MDKNDIEQLLNYISPSLRKYLKKCDYSIWENAEEIRLSILKPAMICYNGGFEYVSTEKGIFICSRETIEETLMLISDNSIYAVNDRLSNGYITIKGGNRAGIVGTAVVAGNGIMAIKDITSINIRIKRQIKGTSDKVINHIVSNHVVNNTLIISPPQCGKTTLLRDIARTLGNGTDEFSPFKVSVIDERSEIASVYEGVAQNDVGLRTDVLDGCSKAIGIPYVIRSMSPEVIITDEIGTEADIEAVNYAARSGVKIISSAHGTDPDELAKRKNFKEIMTLFDIFIVLTNLGGTGNVKNIFRREDIAL